MEANCKKKYLVSYWYEATEYSYEESRHIDSRGIKNTVIETADDVFSVEKIADIEQGIAESMFGFNRNCTECSIINIIPLNS